ncbi:UAA transporter [Geranomyces variabilis]|nr:UAA transporter [Geranomyces variabilis]KAJ3138371.1 UDP-galactose transporter [Geranomyces variabilis]
MLGELAVCVAGIYACFLTWQLTQERVTTHKYNDARFRYFIFLNLVQSLCASTVGTLYQLLVRREALRRPSRALWLKYLQCALLSTCAPLFGYAALKHIDYPTVILGKSCKLVPVLLMNFLIYRRTFPASKYAVVALITAGVSAFMLLHKQEDADGHAKKGQTSSSSLYGLALLLVNLLMDGAVNSTQDRIFHKFHVSGSSMMVFLNLIASSLMAAYLLVWPYTDELAQALAFCSAHPQIIVDILLFGFCGAVGQCFIYHTLERFGAVSLVTVTVTRKMFSILLSFFWFEHHVSPGQWGAVALVFAGIGIEAGMKRSSSAAAAEKGDPKKKIK